MVWSSYWRLVVTVFAGPPVGDLGLVDLEAARQPVGQQAGVRTGGAVDVEGGAAGAADEVVVVVADPGLVARRVPGRLDAADQAGRSEGTEHVVHRLHGDAADALDRCSAYLVGGHVPDGVVEDLEHGQSGGGDAKPRDGKAVAGLHQ
jgi:hypothetical protein